MKKVELITARNEADQTIWMVEKLLKDNADKVSGSDKSAIESAIERCKQAASSNDVQTIKQASSDLKAAAAALGQHLHGGGGGGPSPGGEGPAGGGGDKGKEDVIDAEFEVKK